jgi:hypothetical protein
MTKRQAIGNSPGWLWERGKRQEGGVVMVYSVLYDLFEQSDEEDRRVRGREIEGGAG